MAIDKSLYAAPLGMDKDALNEEPIEIEIEDPESVKIGIGGLELGLGFERGLGRDLGLGCRGGREHGAGRDRHAGRRLDHPPGGLLRQLRAETHAGRHQPRRAAGDQHEHGDRHACRGGPA